MGWAGRDEKRLLARLTGAVSAAPASAPGGGVPPLAALDDEPPPGTAGQPRRGFRSGRDEERGEVAGDDRLAPSARDEVRRAAEELVEASWRQVYASLFRLTGGDRELAADLTQEAYRKAWAALDGFDGRARFATWLYRIAYTTFLNHARRPRRVVPLAEGPGGAGPGAGDDAGAEGGPSFDRDGGHADPGPLPDEVLAASRAQDRLRRAVLELPEDLRYTVTAHYWGDLPVRDLARQEGITGAAVRKRLRKASTLLAARLEAEA